MKLCNEIRSRIDEADHAGRLSLEINRHTAQCADCRTFADERAALRGLVASGASVSVPVNFDAVLNARLAEVKARKSFSWLSPAGYLRLGAATAALAVVFFVAERGNLFSDSYQALSAASALQSLPNSITDNWRSDDLAHGGSTVAVVPNQPRELAPVRYSNGLRYGNGQGRRIAVAPRTPADYVSLDGGGVILVRGQNGERELTVPTVSIGAQPLLYSNRSSQSVRSISVSF
ncbi:MAG TPA: hypothetical protein VJZ26_16395 [Blastocatellia bacterium]|nr:hypothetical protein [Blastocatellia bacterium]